MGNIATAESNDLQSSTTNRFLFDQDFLFSENFDLANVNEAYLSISSNGIDDVDAELDLIAFPMFSPPPPIVDQPEPSTMLALLTVGGASLLAKRRKN